MPALTHLLTQSDPAALALLPKWMDASYWINTFVSWLGPWALVGVCAVVFAETGLMVGFFLPGDSLLFTLGVFIELGHVPVAPWLACLSIALSAVAGNQTGYWIGRLLGPKVFNKPDSRLFKREYVDRTRAFFAKYGGRTIIIAQYVPIVRTFTPVVAGVARMNYRHFVSFNIVAAFSWGIILPLAGMALGQFPWVGDNIDLIIILIVLASVTPMIVEYLKHRAARGRGEPAPAAPAAPPAGVAQEPPTARPAAAPATPDESTLAGQ
ncbi:MAG: VTT domain-containing protein [Bifidobacteriaceae bacterium]|jgi:membrane-associated protein|nr:VTT domain-containing protein [Bifidobacteriaceae bacterium]